MWAAPSTDFIPPEDPGEEAKMNAKHREEEGNLGGAKSGVNLGRKGRVKAALLQLKKNN